MNVTIAPPPMWTNDPAGRIRNISLAPNAKNSMFPLFEAVMNSIHAIEERFGPDNIGRGNIKISIHRGKTANPIGFTVTDNGIGLTRENLDSFKRLDTQKKLKIGGKGVGRLLWLKVCETTSVRSIFVEGDASIQLDFKVTLDSPAAGLSLKKLPKTADSGTTVMISPYYDIYAATLPQKTSTIANRILAHFISFFVNINHPAMIIDDSHETIDLLDQFASSIERDESFSLELQLSSGLAKFILNCFLLPKNISDDEKSTNALYLGAHGRTVRRYEMDGVLGMKAIGGKYAFLGYVSGEILNDSANDTRTGFSLSDEDQDQIVDCAKQKAKEFLKPEVSEIRDKQEKTVEKVRLEHPRFFSIARDPKDVAANLHLSTQTEEEIFIELSRESLRDYKRRKSAFATAVKKNLPDIQTKAKEYVEGLQGQSISSLAEYVMKRKLILQVFEESLKFTDIDSQTSEYENVVHGIICPLKTTSEELNYEDHNLWIVDDRLAFFSYFNSDKVLRAQVRYPQRPQDRPDISIFDLGLGFQNSDTSQPVTIIEFKRPKRDDYTLDSNPITQVRKYVRDMRQAGKLIKYDGTPLREISETTPFVCHIVADITPSLRAVMKDLGPFHQKVGSGTWYRWDDAYCIFIEVSSFKDILDSARVRNHAFFERLGLT